MAFSATSRSTAVAEMNITPLVDVMLVLLIIFMVSAPMLSRTLALDIGAAPPPRGAPPPETVSLRIEPDGSLIWNQQRMPAAVVDAALRLEAGRDVPPVLALEADDATDYQHVSHWMARARMAGLERISL